MIKVVKHPIMLKYLRRHYATVVNGSKKPYISTLEKNNIDDLNQSLRTIFNPKIDKSVVIKEFKLLVNKLNTSSNIFYEKKHCIQELDIIKNLLLDVFGSKYQVELDTKVRLQTISEELKAIIESNKINNEVIFQRIAQFRNTQPINVNVPLNATKTKSSTTLGEKVLQPSLSLSLGNTNGHSKNTTNNAIIVEKDRNNHNNNSTFTNINKVNTNNKNNGQNDILEILDKLESHLLNKNTNTNDLYQIFSNMLEETKPENQLGKHLQSSSDSDIINLDYLKSYLNKIETQEYQKKVVLKEQQRIYNWNTSVAAMNKTNKLVLNDILSLFNPLTWIMSDKNRRIRSLWGVKNSNYFTEYKIYDLQTDKTTNYNTKSERFPLNIEHKDMFEIINNAQLYPEFILSKLKSQQTDNWRLVGSLFNDPNKIIFKRMISTSNISYFSYILKSVCIVISCNILYKTCICFFDWKKEIKSEEASKL